MAGDCYSANGRWMIGKDNSYRLVHGVAILPRDGKPFGHCWIEKGNQVLDYSNGKKIKLPKNYIMNWEIYLLNHIKFINIPQNRWG